MARACSTRQSGMLIVTLTCASRSSRVRTSMSRSTSGDFVMIPTGLPYSAHTSRHPRVNRYEASSGW
jgi:hypothetical protein